VVSRNLTVQGDAVQCAAAAGSLPAPVSGLCTLSGADLYRLFEVYVSGGGATLTLSGLALVHGSDVLDGKGGAAVLLLPGSAHTATALNATGCVFQANNATGVGPGGAVAANPSSMVTGLLRMTLTDTVFTSNTALTAGGAVFASGPTTLHNVNFSANSATFPAAELTATTLNVPGSNGLGFGGALQLGSCAAAAGSLTVVGGAWSNNWGTNGGAMVCGPSCTCTLSGGVSFANNSATGAFLVGGAGVSGNGGAIAALANSTLIVTDASFTNNTCSSEGGAVYMSGNKVASLNYALGGLYGLPGHTGAANVSVPGTTSVAVALAPSSGIFTAVTLAGNVAGVTGGGIYAEGAGALLNVSASSIAGGAAGKKGGGIYSSSSSAVNVIDTSVSACTAGTAGGGIAVGASVNLTLSASTLSGCTSSGTGGGLFVDVNGTASLASMLFSSCGAALGGGGMFVSASTALSAANVSYASCTSAAGGGALQLSSLSTATLHSCSFVGCSAASAGGALLASSAASVSLASTLFLQNSAAGVAPHGGAVAAENVGVVSILACNFTANAATQALSNNAPVGAAEVLVYAGANSAGALFLGAAAASAGGVPMYASIADTTFAGCSASGAGGALAALSQTTPITLSITGTSAFTDNGAGTDGGAMSAAGAVTATITGVTFAGNNAARNGGVALLDDGTSTALSGATCSANVAAGSGGVLKLQGASGASTAIAGGSFTTNSALYGGAVAVLGSAHTLSLSGAATFSTNNATYGGVFSLTNVTQAVNSQVTLSGATLTTNVGSVGALFFSDAVVASPACTGCTLSANVASNYGAVSATNAAGIATAPQSFTAASATASVTSGTACTLNLMLADGYNNQVTSWPGFVAALAPATELSGVLTASAVAAGVSTISTARVTGTPLSSVTLSVVVTSPPLVGAATQSVAVTIAQCGANEVFQAATSVCLCDRGYFLPSGIVGACQPCAAGTYAAGIGEVGCTSCAATAVSLPASSACSACPAASRPLTDSICMCENDFYGTFADTNNGSCTACPENALCQTGIIVSAPGYWHSSSASTDVQACVEEAACDYPNRAATLVAMALNGTDEATLLAAQCSDGYEGTLCAQCSAGYGRDTDLTCGECPSFSENTGKLALTSFTNILSIGLTVRTLSNGAVAKPLHSQIIKVFLNYLTVTSLASRAPLKWPKRIEELLAAQSTGTHSSGKTVAIECSMPLRDRPKFYDLVSGYLILVPIAAVVFPLVLWAAVYACIARPGAQQASHEARFRAWWEEKHAGGAGAVVLPDLGAVAAADVPPTDERPDEAPARGGGEDDAVAAEVNTRDSYASASKVVFAQELTKEDIKFEAQLNALVAPRQLGSDAASARATAFNLFVITFVVIIFYVWCAHARLMSACTRRASLLSACGRRRMCAGRPSRPPSCTCLCACRSTRTRPTRPTTACGCSRTRRRSAGRGAT
jgi:predicted outer membrane repeat protein